MRGRKVGGSEPLKIILNSELLGGIKEDDGNSCKSCKRGREYIIR